MLVNLSTILGQGHDVNTKKLKEWTITFGGGMGICKYKLLKMPCV